MNPDLCNAPHPQIALFFCDAPFKHAGDHTCQPRNDKRVFWRNYLGEINLDGWAQVDLSDDPRPPSPLPGPR